MDIQKSLLAGREGKVRKYQRLIVGREGFRHLIRYELTLLLASWVPGALGLFLRSKLYPGLFRRCGKNVSFGSNLVIRHPHKISIGKNVVIDDNVVIDAKGRDNRGISIGNGVFIGRNSNIFCQDGDISLGERTNIGPNCQIFSAKRVQVGKGVLVGAYAYLIGGGHNHERVDMPIIDQGRSAKGIIIHGNIWIGAGAKVLDGVRIGEGAIVGTGAVVTSDIPEYAVAAGVPAKIVRDRRVEEGSFL